MDAQGEPDVLQSTLLQAPGQINTSLDDSIREDVLLRFQIVESMRGMPLIEGTTWALVSKPWYRRFEKAATGQVDKEGGVKEDHLGPVDNSTLLEVDGRLKEGLVEGIDVEYVPEIVWGWLTKLYVLPLRKGTCSTHPLSADMARQSKIPSKEGSSPMASKENPP